MKEVKAIEMSLFPNLLFMQKNVPLFGNSDSRSGSGQDCHMNLVQWTCCHWSSIHSLVEGIGSHSMRHLHGSILPNSPSALIEQIYCFDGI